MNSSAWVAGEVCVWCVVCGVWGMYVCMYGVCACVGGGGLVLGLGEGGGTASAAKPQPMASRKLYCCIGRGRMMSVTRLFPYATQQLAYFAASATRGGGPWD